MSSPANQNTSATTPPAHSGPVKSKAEAARGVLRLLVFLSSFVLWPVYFVFAVGVALWRVRRLLFPFRARVNRKHFWNILLLYSLLGFLLFAMIEGAVEAGLSRIVGVVLEGLLGAGIVLSLAALAIARLHDRNMSGWWILLYCGVPAAAAGAAFIFSEPPSPLINFCILVLVGSVAWALFALGCQSGEVGPNRFGPEGLWYRGSRRPASPRVQTNTPQLPAHGSDSLRPAALTDAASAAPTAVSIGDLSSQGTSSSIDATNYRWTVQQQFVDLISVRGRLDPRRYWICTAVQCAYTIFAWSIIQTVTSNRGISQQAYWLLVGVVAFLPAGLSMIATAMRRLHDRNLPGWWLPGFCALLFALMELAYLIFARQLVWDQGLLFGLLGVAIWRIGRLPGTVGPNQFGPDPVDHFLTVETP